MEVSEVRIKLMEEPGDRLKAFCSVTFDNCFVIRDLKIIEGTTGLFVAMPSRKLTAHCRKCGSKNHLRATYCNQCGDRQPEGRAPKDADGRAKLYADIAHPINSACREMVQTRVVEEFLAEQQRSRQPDYVSRYDDYDLGFEESRQEKSYQEKATRADSPHVDQPHGGATVAQPHIVTNAPPAGSGSERGASEHRPHFLQDSTPKETPSAESATNEPAAGDDNPPISDGFGAGVFPR